VNECDDNKDLPDEIFVDPGELEDQLMAAALESPEVIDRYDF